MPENIDFSPQPSARESENKIKFPPITEMYRELGRLRELFNGKAEIELMGKGQVEIDQNFKPLGDKILKLGTYGVLDSGKQMIHEKNTEAIEEAIGEMRLSSSKELEKDEGGRLRKDLVGMDKLLHFNFGDLNIDLEGRPIYQITDNGVEREKFRHLADNQKEAQNPGYVFSINLKDEQSFRVQVNPDGTVKILSPHLENIYVDAVTGEKTKKRELVLENRKRSLVDFEEEVPPSLLRKILRIPAKKVWSKKESEWTEKEVKENKLIGGPRKEIKLGADYPEKHQLAMFLTEMLKESIRALKDAEKTAPKAVSVEL